MLNFLYNAYLNNDPKLWGCGSTPNAAIGDVVHTHYKELNVKIILEWEMVQNDEKEGWIIYKRKI